MKSLDLTNWTRGLLRHKYLLLVLLLGLVLLLLPRSTGITAQTEAAAAPAKSARGDPMTASGIPLEAEGERLAELLSAVEGVGETRVLLSAEGAVVVCDGANDPLVQLRVTEAIRVYTGLGSDRVRVMKRSRRAEQLAQTQSAQNPST